MAMDFGISATNLGHAFPSEFFQDLPDGLPVPSRWYFAGKVGKRQNRLHGTFSVTLREWALSDVLQNLQIRTMHYVF